jgi:transcriptional regulator NrdR family protein
MIIGSESISYTNEINDSDNCLSITKIQNLYLKLIYQQKFYGLTFFRCEQPSTKLLSANPILALHQRGITIFDKSRKQLLQFNIEDILRWGFQPNQMFYFEPAEEKYGMLKFQTDKGEQISKLIGDYARAFVEEKELEDNRFIQLNNDLKQQQQVVNQTQSTSVKMKKHVSFELKQKPKKPIHNVGIIRFQALYRGFSLRNEYQNAIKEEYAIRIQAGVRGFITRNAVNIMIENMLEELQGRQ